MAKFDRDKKRRLVKIGTYVGIPVLAVSVGFASYASDSLKSSSVWDIPYAALGHTPLSHSSNISAIASNNFALNSLENMDMVQEATEAAQKAAESKSIQCADPSKAGGLGEVQKKKMEEERQKDLATVNLDKIFNIGKKGGCFNALGEFPDLSASIPSITGIMNSVKDTLAKYATRKACAVVDEALQGVVGPVSEAVNKVSDRGRIDLNGRVSSEMTKQMYEIDPELGRVSSAPKPGKEYDVEFKW